jgi:hypothetical protein
MFIYIIVSLIKQPKPVNPLITQMIDYIYMRNPISPYYKENNISVSRIFNYEEVKTTVANILKISLILRHYGIANNDKSIKRVKILIYTNYLLCWSYILIVSLPSLYNTLLINL